MKPIEYLLAVYDNNEKESNCYIMQDDIIQKSTFPDEFRGLIEYVRLLFPHEFSGRIKLESLDKEEDCIIFYRKLNNELATLVERLPRVHPGMITGQEDNTLRWFLYLGKSDALGSNNLKLLFNRLNKNLEQRLIPISDNLDSKIIFSVYDNSYEYLKDMQYFNGKHVKGYKSDVDNYLIGGAIQGVNSFSKNYRIKNIYFEDKAILLDFMNNNEVEYTFVAETNNYTGVERDLLTKLKSIVSTFVSTYGNRDYKKQQELKNKWLNHNRDIIINFNKMIRQKTFFKTKIDYYINELIEDLYEYDIDVNHEIRDDNLIISFSSCPREWLSGLSKDCETCQISKFLIKLFEGESINLLGNCNFRITKLINE